MNSSPSYRSYGIFLGFLILGTLDFLLRLSHLRIIGFLGLPFWIFYFPLCLWEFAFWARIYLRSPSLTNSYVLLLLSGILLGGLFDWVLLFPWVIAVLCFFILQKVELARQRA